MVTILLQHIGEMSTTAKQLSPFLADRTNSRAYATVVRLSVCRLWHCGYWLYGAS